MTTQELHTKLETLLAEHKQAVASDPQANPVKLLAYDISKAVEDRSIAFRDIEALVKSLSDQGAIDRANRLRDRAGIDRFSKHFPKKWTTLTPHLADAYSWVGYDIDGRTDISWGDALRLRLSEKRDQLSRYAKEAARIAGTGDFKSEAEDAVDNLSDRIKDGLSSAERDLALFEKDLDNPDNLVSAANNLTRKSSRRFTELTSLLPDIETAIAGAPKTEIKRDLICLRAQMKAFGLGTARIHFRLNARHVMSGVKGIFGLSESGSDTRTVLNRATNYNVQGVTALVFNTHGEGLGRGGHPGTIKDRLDYAMSPWAILQFERRGIHLCHETSFQGGDGYLWFQTPKLADATIFSLISGRMSDRSAAADDPFYTEKDFSWDVYRTIGSEQDALYSDPNYVSLLGGLGQNMLIPTGSRAVKRAKSGSGADMFNPRLLRAIPHNAILQQFGAPANIVYGTGRAVRIDAEKFEALYANSARAKSIFDLVIKSMGRTNLSILTSYGRLFDPGFWISRALSGAEPLLADRSLIVAETLEALPWRSQIMDLGNRLRLDKYDSHRVLGRCDESADFSPNDTLIILHALRLAVIMKMLILKQFSLLPRHISFQCIYGRPDTRFNSAERKTCFGTDLFVGLKF